MSDADKKRGALGLFVKFGLVGVLNTAIDFGALFLLSLAGLPREIGKIFSYSAGIVNSYVWNTRWTFGERTLLDPKRMLKFLAVNLVALGIGILVLRLAASLIARVPALASLSPAALNLLANAPSVVVSIVVNFILNSLWTYRKAGEKNHAEAPRRGGI